MGEPAEKTDRWEWLKNATYNQALSVYSDMRKAPAHEVAEMGRRDRFYLLTHILMVKKMFHPWLYDRCREVEAEPDGYLDLWAREHFKSTIITFAGSIQEIINDPEITIGILSFNTTIARDFVSRIKRECEINPNLHKYYPEIFWENPKKESPSWSRDGGLIVKRKGNPNEATVSGWGLVDSQPTSKHFQLMIYDDVVTEKSVTPDMIPKTTESWELSRHLSARREDGSLPRTWMPGTRYNFADTYRTVMDRKAATPRIYPATKDGTMDGEPVLLTQAEWDNKKQESSPYTIACHCQGTSILMGDWGYKSVEDILVGDFVVGFEIGRAKGQKTNLVKTEVVAVNKRKAFARRYFLESGSIVECTPTHQWWAKRGFTDSHKQYSQLGDLKHRDLKYLYRVVSHVEEDGRQQWQYLAGLLDGEGSISGRRINITQSKEHNPEVYKRIEETLNLLGIDYSMYHREAHERHGKKSKGSSIFLFNGGRETRHRILLNANPAKKQKIIDSLYCKVGGKSTTTKDRVVRFEDIGEVDVYNIQTKTGNYIANGYWSKNCQMLQNPIAGSEAEFMPEWMREYEVRPETINVVILVDPAGSVKGGTSNTAFAVIGVDHAHNKFLLDGACHKMNLTEKWVMLKAVRKKWIAQVGVQSIRVGYEKYAHQSDIEHYETMMKIEKYAFPIEVVNWVRDGEQSKNDRIRRLIPDHQNWRFFYPYSGEDETKLQKETRERGQGYLVAKKIKRKDQNGRLYDLVEYLKTNEILFFPATTRKDLLDAMSRVYDMKVGPPMIVKPDDLVPQFMGDL